ncbi:MAG: acetyl-CoA carboxylase biotin carboxyl carrier protein subunit, partial [Pelagibacteraceae bacterium]|nr:acetyl-CoA carboxylase biotin carboxyl carrier protein subunit [Pelagibacteraceae bacterium]
DKKLIKELVDYLNEFNLTELEYGQLDTKIKVSKKKSDISTANEITQLTTEKKKTDLFKGVKITSPIVGTAYLAPETGGKKFIEVGKKIKKGNTVMIVEAMKTMNHVPSPKDGIVKEICVEDGQPVEFAQLLVLLE